MAIIGSQPIGGNTSLIREVNRNLVRHALKAQGTATKKQLSEATGLSLVTVGTVLQELISSGEVRETEPVSSNGGRPALKYAYNERHALVLILFPVERGGRLFIHRAVADLAGERLEEAEIPADIVELALFQRLIDESMAAYRQIRAIGIGLPGAEYEGELIVSDYENLKDKAILEHLGSRYRLPVVIENDVNAAAVGFWLARPSHPDTTGVYLYFPDRFPPGAGIFIDGKLYRGKRGFAGEVANIPLGIPWGDTALAASEERLCEALAKLAISVISVLNPDSVVLCGSFITADHIQTVKALCADRLPKAVLPEIVLSDTFEEDYARGMVVQTLSKLEPDLLLTRLER
ncbi:ROK family protein [Cohnella candidum]|uniref:ROK family protein n=1 Tax=Cohnella candidum TaxID=2674991 RepID=UPI001F14C5BF|nr:ROK family protein [Cohnella candidum]